MSAAAPRGGVFVGIGANLPSRRFGEPAATCAAAVSLLESRGVHVIARSRWYRSAPVPDTGQPWFVNGVIEVATTLAPAPLLALLHEIEAEAGRERPVRWAPRVLDLDLLAYGALVTPCDARPALPHPRLHERAFVLAPLAEIAPGWRHPKTGDTVERMFAAVGEGQTCFPIEDGGGP